jgi:hypothetical protein
MSRRCGRSNRQVDAGGAGLREPVILGFERGDAVLIIAEPALVFHLEENDALLKGGHLLGGGVLILDHLVALGEQGEDEFAGDLAGEALPGSFDDGIEADEIHRHGVGLVRDEFVVGARRHNERFRAGWTRNGHANAFVVDGNFLAATLAAKLNHGNLLGRPCRKNATRHGAVKPIFPV